MAAAKQQHTAFALGRLGSGAFSTFAQLGLPFFSAGSTKAIFLLILAKNRLKSIYSTFISKISQ
jgi:hypothetical protein